MSRLRHFGIIGIGPIFTSTVGYIISGDSRYPTFQLLGFLQFPGWLGHACDACDLRRLGEVVLALRSGTGPLCQASMAEAEKSSDDGKDRPAMNFSPWRNWTKQMAWIWMDFWFIDVHCFGLILGFTSESRWKLPSEQLALQSRRSWDHQRRRVWK